MNFEQDPTKESQKQYIKPDHNIIEANSDGVEQPHWIPILMVMQIE